MLEDLELGHYMTDWTMFWCNFRTPCLNQQGPPTYPWTSNCSPVLVQPGMQIYVCAANGAGYDVNREYDHYAIDGADMCIRN